jgi:hypothetical protein
LRRAGLRAVFFAAVLRFAAFFLAGTRPHPFPADSASRKREAPHTVCECNCARRGVQGFRGFFFLPELSTTYASDVDRVTNDGHNNGCSSR